MSSKLIFDFRKVRIKPELEESFRKEFEEEFGFIISFPVLVQFLRKDGSWMTLEAIFDTGASISLFSKQVGDEIGIEKYVPHRLTGISRKDECSIPVRITKVKARLIDSIGNVSPEFDLWVAFAEISVPHVLGMKGIAERFEFKTDLKAKRLYLEWSING